MMLEMMKTRNNILYTWERFNPEAFIENYTEFCSDRDEVDTDTIPISCGAYEARFQYSKGEINDEELSLAIKSNNDFLNSPGEVVHIEAKKALKSHTILKVRVLFLIHTIIKQVAKNEEYNEVRLSSDFLRSVFGEYYKAILLVLIKMGFMQYGSAYTEEHCQGYIILDSSVASIHLNEAETSELIRLRKKAEDKLESLRTQNIEKQKQALGISSEFLDRYEIALNKFKLTDPASFESFIEKDIDSRTVYNHIIASQMKMRRKITKIDNQKRIYHILTNLKRGYKKFFNIDYAIDCHNSHPVLFNHFIFAQKNVDNVNAFEICNLCQDCHRNYENITPTFLRYYLWHNGIENSILSTFKDDELKYIFATTNGLLWDEIISYSTKNSQLMKLVEKKKEEKDDDTRSIIKQTMFAEVFYSRYGKIGYNDGECEKPFGDVFRKFYPTVYSFICKFKGYKRNREMIETLNEFGLDLENNHRGTLARLMMRLESEIFESALDTIFRQRKLAINIHDCIIVPKVPTNNVLNENETEEILVREFRKYGLRPTFGIEHYAQCENN